MEFGEYFSLIVELGGSMKTNESLLQLSAVVVDLVYQVDCLPKSGEEAKVHGFDLEVGGGYNAMVAAIRSGMTVTYGNLIGRGPFGEMVLQELNKEGIASLLDRVVDQDQGCCTVLLEPNGERTFVSADGAESMISPLTMQTIKFHEYDWMLLNGYCLTGQVSMATFMNLFHDLEALDDRKNIPKIVFDASPKIDRIADQCMEKVYELSHWISLNLREAEFLTDRSDPKESARILVDRKCPGGGVVVRTGETGCVVACGDQIYEVRGHPVEAVDTTGAGDTHVGAFIAALATGRSAVDAAKYANIVAAVSTTRKGPATAPMVKDIEHLL